MPASDGHEEAAYAGTYSKPISDHYPGRQPSLPSGGAGQVVNNQRHSDSADFSAREALLPPEPLAGSAAFPDSLFVGRSSSPSTPSSWSRISHNEASHQPPSRTRNPSQPAVLRALGRGPRASNLSHRSDSSIDEYDMSLLRNAAPIGRESRRDPIAPKDEGGVVEGSPEPVVDLTSMVGPMAFREDPFLKNLQEQEATGHLTGGLGAGFTPDTRIKDKDLLSSPATSSRSLSRRFSRGPPKLSRAATIQSLGQDEANKRGEVIEVIVEEGEERYSTVDLSAMVGPDGLHDDRDVLRQSSLPPSKPEARVFYPQPNWKPFSMRWPYLLALIVLSVALAIMEECIYRRSRQEPLVRFKSPSTVPGAKYFAFKFLPTILAVAYGVLWQITAIEVKRLEAFYQLSKPGGALAAESINVDYVTSWVWLRPYWAIKSGHWAVAISSVASTIAVSLVPTCGAASIILTPGRTERLADPYVEKQIVMHPVWSRLVVTTLAVCAALGCLLLYTLQTRRSGLLADVKGIAGLASMAVVSHILVDFAGLDVVRHSEIHAKLKHNRYVLRNACLAPDDGSEKPRQETADSLRERDSRLEHDHLSQNPLPAMLCAKGYVPFATGVAALLAFIPVTLFTPASTVTEHAPWLVTAFAVCVKLTWGSMDTDVRMMEPYYILSGRHADPSILTLDYTAMPFGYLPVRAALNGHALVFLVGFGSVMAEVLTVLLTSIATVQGSDFAATALSSSSSSSESSSTVTTGAETPLSFWLSFALALFVLLYMLAVSTLVFVRRRHPFLPRQPNTIASVLAYIHQSKMIYGFVGTSRLRASGMARHLASTGGTYGLGLFEGRDGRKHCGVDQEELLGDYVHGVDFEIAGNNRPWDRKWDTYD